MLNDLRFALRMLRKNPGFTTLIVLMLALGIGGTTAIFSVVYGGLLDAFPYVDSHRLAVLITQNPGTGRDGGWAWVSGRELLDYQEQNKVFDEVFGAAGEDVLMKRAEGAVFLDGVRVTSSFFGVLGMPTLTGRPLGHEDAKPGASPVAVLSFKGWRSHFGGDAAVGGKTFVMDRSTHDRCRSNAPTLPLAESRPLDAGNSFGIGVPASIALARILQSRIWGINSSDPLTLIAVPLVLTAVGLTACYFPARRATKVEPMVALRTE
jgi:ABC-type antimicrobial peptide transport system permease subunit